MWSYYFARRNGKQKLVDWITLKPFVHWNWLCHIIAVKSYLDLILLLKRGWYQFLDVKPVYHSEFILKTMHETCLKYSWNRVQVRHERNQKCVFPTQVRCVGQMFGLDKIKWKKTAVLWGFILRSNFCFFAQPQLFSAP